MILKHMYMSTINHSQIYNVIVGYCILNVAHLDNQNISRLVNLQYMYAELSIPTNLMIKLYITNRHTVHVHVHKYSFWCNRNFCESTVTLKTNHRIEKRHCILHLHTCCISKNSAFYVIVWQRLLGVPTVRYMCVICFIRVC